LSRTAEEGEGGAISGIGGKHDCGLTWAVAIKAAAACADPVAEEKE